ncbi:hypothetical protein ACQPW1_14760 [Nocardia sp. CA-128927]|uniref:hypothetical protein n=1 Tax=Nocardia sp. CA-128927 TaxID=3239975 RepID=UPI003D973A8A
MTGRIGLVSIDGGGAVPMICHLLSGGDVIVPAAAEHALVEDVVGHTVRVEFGTCGGDQCAPWTVSSADRPVRVAAIDHRRWYLRTAASATSDSGNSVVRVQVSTAALASRSLSAV